MTRIAAQKTRRTFALTYTVAVSIDAPAAAVWALITDAAALPRWNSTISAVEGTIAEGERIALQVKIAPERTFKLKVSDMVPEQQMVWSDGFAPMFKGVRTYRLEVRGGRTRFSMEETFSGLMLPLIAGSLPDFTADFEAWAADLKVAAEGAAQRVGA